jgi:hypothetical protein
MTINHLCVDGVEIACTDDGTAAPCDGWATTACSLAWIETFPA